MNVTAEGQMKWIWYKSYIGIVKIVIVVWKNIKGGGGYRGYYNPNKLQKVQIKKEGVWWDQNPRCIQRTQEVHARRTMVQTGDRMQRRCMKFSIETYNMHKAGGMDAQMPELIHSMQHNGKLYCHIDITSRK